MCVLTHHDCARYGIVFCLRGKCQERFCRRRGEARGQQITAMVENTFANDADLVDGFAFTIDDFRHPLAQTPVVINPCKPQVFIGEEA